MYLVSRNSWIPSKPPSRPNPDCLTPPNGAAGSEISPRLIATIPDSIARNHPLIDGNKRLAWAATRTFCLLNGYDIYNDVDSAEQIVLAVATGKLDVPEIATALEIRKGK